MANWISSKLKAAETILQQIDQQAAESLRKGERLRIDEYNIDASNTTGDIVPLKDQLKKNKFEKSDHHGMLRTDPNFDALSTRDNGIASAPKSAPNSKATLTDSDWTELLSAPSQPSTSAANRTIGVSSIRGLKREGKRQGNAGSNMSALKVKRNQKSNNTVSKSARGVQSREMNKLTGKESEGEESSFSDSVQRVSSLELKNDEKDKLSERPPLAVNETEANISVEIRSEENTGSDGNFYPNKLSSEDFSPAEPVHNNRPSGMMPIRGKVEKMSETKIRVDHVKKFLGSTAVGKHKSNVASGGSTDDIRKSSSTSDGSSSSDSGSESDSESEREREERKRRRERILAEKAAAKALEVVKAREDMVAKLEGEKDSLEKILEERARQQAQEATELQTTMVETMEAVELEKQKHNNTRKEALTILAKLETTNADLARTLAAAQRNLEEEANRVAELRQQIELKEAIHEEFRRRISSSQQTRTSLKQLTAMKGVEFEKEILEAEYSLVTDKVLQLKEKAKNLEENIEIVRRDIEEPTEVEMEIKRRLGQLTDHLIHKQAQVEALSSEKATLVFRIEAVTRMLEENKLVLNIDDSSSRDLESRSWQINGSNLRPMLENKIHLGKKHLGSLLQQLDALYVAGTVFLRRNPTAKLWSLVYLVCLHFWVIYILTSHSQVTNGSKSGAVVSLENINTS